MNSARTRTIVSAFSLVLVTVPMCRAQTQTNVPNPPSADLNRRIDDLEKQLADLHSQLTDLKRANSTAGSTPTAPPVPTQNLVATATPEASQTGGSKSTLANLLGPTSFSGFVDTYYNYNFNQPAARSNVLRSFETNSNQFSLNMVELVVDKAPDAAASRTGYHVALGYGQAMNAINSTDPGGLGFDQYLKEAYFSYLAPVGKGLQIDVGKFVTPAGAEVIESKDNWNYSRGLLFSWAIPYYHFGLRSKYTFNDKYSLTGYMVNGWNNVVDNNTAKTYGLSFGWNPTKKLGFAENYMGGPEGVNNNTDWRQLWDTVVTYNATSKLSLMANYDYGRGDRVKDVVDPTFWSGIAGYVKYAVNSKYAFATRYEYFDDHNGFSTGTAQHVQEVTGTVQRTIADHIISRIEYRRDLSNRPVFTTGSNRGVGAQDTLAAGLVFTFDSHEIK